MFHLSEKSIEVWVKTSGRPWGGSDGSVYAAFKGMCGWTSNFTEIPYLKDHNRFEEGQTDYYKFTGKYLDVGLLVSC